MSSLDDHPPPSFIDLDDDDDDRPLDFRFLSLSSPSLPRRGEKDFEHHGTAAQLSTLEASRAAMHEALSVGRSHGTKAALVGHARFKQLRGEGGEVGLEVVVKEPRGQHLRTMGRTDRRGRVKLLPEEVVYLVERGTMEVRYEGEEEEKDEERGETQKEGYDEEEDVDGRGWDGIAMSLQACYAWFIGRDGLTLERYTVYAGLKRSGYTVMRSPWWGGGGMEAEGNQAKEDRVVASRGELGLWGLFWSMVLRWGEVDLKALGPLVGKGLYRNYSMSYSKWSFEHPANAHGGDIYRLLSIIPAHNPSISSTQFKTTDDSSMYKLPKPPILRPCFHLWKPSQNFRKSAPGPPDFQSAVLNAREEDFPTLQQLDGLLQSVPYDPPLENDTRIYQNLKHGFRNVLLAVVDQGVVSFLRIADAGFATQKIYERIRRGNKGKRGGSQGKRSEGRKK
ncbi:MAG: hypothetical protein LQ342_000953 [Letrouitia transgressa]|nr:MAG: hypothetical protein LQ342_000953 [Letrouitia transgressa]